MAKSPPGMTLPGLRALRLGLFLWGAAEGLFIYLLPLQIRILGGDARAVGLVAAIQAAVAGISMFVAGPIVDRLGRAPLIRFGAVIVIPGTIIWAVAPHWQWMIVGTLFWAVSFAGYPAITAYVTASHDDHVGIFGSTFAFFSLGMIVTPGIGGLIAAGAGSIRPVFLVSMATFAAAAASIWKLPPQPNQPATPLRATVEVLLHERRLLALCGYLVVLVIAMNLTTSFVGPYLQDVDHANDALVGMLGACVSLGEFLMGQSLGLVNARVGRTWTLAALQGALALSLCLVLRTDWLPLVMLAFLLRGAIVTSSTMVLAFVGGLVPPRYQGTGFGLLELALQAGTMAAAFTGGILYAGGARRPFMFSLILLAVTVCATLVWLRRLTADRGDRRAV